MHVYIGGAYNGKRAYVRQLLETQQKKDVAWFDGRWPKAIPNNEVIVMAGLERMLEERIDELEEVVAEEIMTHFLEWSKKHELIVIVTDVGRGIVPIDRNMRKLRDMCGRMYQRLFEESTDVTRIWYGIAKPLKSNGTHIK